MTTVDNRVSLSTKRKYRLNSDTLFKVVTDQPILIVMEGSQINLELEQK
jgi:hypothetical protein